MTVDAAAPLVDVQSAGISEVVEQEQIVELPLQGRRVTDLIVLAGAAVNTGDVSGQRNRQDAVAISVAGGLRTGVAYVLDGAMHNDPYDNTNMPFPFPDALQEFSVATGGLSAQSGHALRRGGQRRHAIGDQRVSWQRLRVPAASPVQLVGAVCARSERTASR